MKPAYFVVGPEGCGTNMLEEAFVSAGCHRRQADAAPTDDLDFSDVPTPFVIRRSLPHAGYWPSLAGIFWRMVADGLDPVAVLILRDWSAARSSILRRDKRRDPIQVRSDQMRAFKLMGFAFQQPTLVIYEAFVLHGEVRRSLFHGLGLREPALTFEYANRRYYGDPICG